MKRLFFFALLAAVAGAGSAFTSAKSTTDTVLVQISEGVYESRPSADGDCTTPVTPPCKYTITTEGKAIISPNTSYSLTDIAAFQSHVPAYIVLEPGTANKLYED